MLCFICLVDVFSDQTLAWSDSLSSSDAKGNLNTLDHSSRLVLVLKGFVTVLPKFSNKSTTYLQFKGIDCKKMLSFYWCGGYFCNSHNCIQLYKIFEKLFLFHIHTCKLCRLMCINYLFIRYILCIQHIGQSNKRIVILMVKVNINVFCKLSVKQSS